MTSGESGLELIIDHTFDSPRELVWEAWTVPELTKQWNCPKGLVTTVLEMDVRPGGAWRSVSHGEEGEAYPFRRRELVEPAPQRTTTTFDFEPWPDHVSLGTAVFKEIGGRALVASVSTVQSVEERDGMMESGAESGIRVGHERLDALLATRIGG